MGPQVHDARIAALCLQNGVRELWSADRDFGRFPVLRTRMKYIDFVRAGVGLPSLWEDLKGQISLGGEPFVQQMAAPAESNLEALEVPRAQRRPLAPPPSHFLDGHADPKEGMLHAHGTRDYTLAQVAQAFAVHYSTASRAVNGRRLGRRTLGPEVADRRIDR